jgi:hypothetical protein
MSWIKKWKNFGLFINMACSMHMIRGVPVIILIGVVLSKVWERENFFDACSGVFDWEMLLVGPIAAMLIVLLCYINYLKSGTVLLHIGGRTKLFKSILWANVVTSFVISVWITFVMLVLEKLVFGNVTDISATLTLLRAGVSVWMLLIVLGSIFMVVQWLFHCIAGILAVLGIVGLEAAEEMYFGNQLFWKYAFPIDSTLYYTWTGFFVGMIWLMLLSFVLNSILFVVLQNKDFILKKLESGE